jgi:hypothetical protein
MKRFLLAALFTFGILLSANSVHAQTSQTGRFEVGPTGNRPATCISGDVYDATDGTFLVTKCGPANTWVAIGTGTTTNPGGANTQIQFNRGGIFGGDANFIWDYTNHQLTILPSPSGNTISTLQIGDPLSSFVNFGGGVGGGSLCNYNHQAVSCFLSQQDTNAHGPAIQATAEYSGTGLEYPTGQFYAVSNQPMGVTGTLPSTALQGAAINVNAGSPGAMFGVRGRVTNTGAGSTVGNMQAFHSDNDWPANGITNNSMTGYFAASAVTGTGTVHNLYGFYADRMFGGNGATGADTIAAGFYSADSSTSSPVEYSFYSAGTKAHFPNLESTTFTISGQILSTLATGTAPFVIASTTNVANLNASFLNGGTFPAPGVIGGTTPNIGHFTGISCALSTKSSAYPLTESDCNITVTGTTTITVPHSIVGQIWRIFNTGSSVVTLQPDSGLINGSASITLVANTGAGVTCDGTNCETYGFTGTVSSLVATGNVTFSGLLTSGTVINSVCSDSSGHLIAVSSANCFGGGGGGGATLQTNNVNNASQAIANFINGTFNGLTLTFSNPAGGNVQLGATGTLNNAGLTNSSIILNGQTVSLGSSGNIPFQTNSTNNTSLIGINFETSTTNSCGLISTPTNSATNIEKEEVTGTDSATCGGTGLNTSASTGVAQVAAGTWSISSALTNGTTATTQTESDATTKIATDAFVAGIQVLSSLSSIGTIGTGVWQGTLIGSTYGGTGQNSSSATGVAQLSGGAWSFSTGLANGTTGITQGNGDNTTKIATDAFVLNNSVTNPMTTLGDEIYGGASGAMTRLAGPTGPNGVPQVVVEIPAAGAATAEVFALGGIPVNNNSETTCATYTLNALDRATAILCSGGTTATITLPIHTTAGFGSNFPFIVANNNSGTLTLTPSTDTIDNGTLLTKWASFTYNNASGNWQTVQVPQFAAFGSTCSNGLTWSTATSFGCLSAAPIKSGDAAGGDLSGTYANPTVAQIEGAAIPTTAAVVGTNSSKQLIAATPHQVALPIQCADTSSSATTYTCTTTPSIGSLTIGDTFILTTINQNNSGSSTLNIDSIGAKTIKKYQNTANLAANDLQANATVVLIYDGTNLEISQIGNAPSGSGTVNGGTAGQLAYYATSTTAVSSAANASISSGSLTLGASGTLGAVIMGNATSGTITLEPQTGALGSVTVSIPAATDTLVNLAGTQTLVNKTLTSPTLTTPALGAATATSLLASGIVDGEAPVTVTTSASCTLGTASGCNATAYDSGYTYNEDATAGAAITYTLPTAAAGKQYCVGNAYNGSNPNTGTLEIATSAAGQFIIYTDGTLSASGGNVKSAGVARDSACVVGVDSTHWVLYVYSGTWAKN